MDRLGRSSWPLPTARRRRLLASLAAGALLIGLVPDASATVDIPTVTTLTISNVDPHRGDMVHYTVTVAPEPGGVGYVSLETSPDGLAWTEYQLLSAWSSAGVIEADVPIAADEAIGLRRVRARFHGVNEFLGSISDPPIDQTIARRVTSVDGLHLRSPNGHEAFVPDSWLAVEAFVQGGGGTLVFEELVGPDWVEFGRTTVPYNQGGGSGGEFQRSGFPLGSHTIRARLLEDALDDASVSDPLTFESTKAPSNPVVSGPDEVQTNHPFDLYASLAPPSTGVAPDGTLTVTEVGTGEVLATYTGAWPQGSLSLTPRPLGTYTFVADFSGDGDFEAQVGTPFVVHVVADTVDAGGIGVSLATFYPVKDGYRDLETVTGTRYEPASVSVRIYSPTKKLVKKVSIATGTGAYAYRWNGRVGASVLPAGRYRIVQTLTDSAGSRRVVTNSATISHKRLVSQTIYVVKSGHRISAKGTTGAAHVTVSSGGHYTKLTSTSGIAGVGYALTLPKATVYSSIRFQISARAHFAAPANEIGVQNFTTCPYSAEWSVGCFDHWSSFGTTSGTRRWASTPASVTVNRHGKIVRGIVVVSYGTVYVYEARLKVVYKVLR